MDLCEHENLAHWHCPIESNGSWLRLSVPTNKRCILVWHDLTDIFFFQSHDSFFGERWPDDLIDMGAVRKEEVCLVFIVGTALWILLLPASVFCTKIIFPILQRTVVVLHSSIDSQSNASLIADSGILLPGATEEVRLISSGCSTDDFRKYSEFMDSKTIGFVC